jgi:hypothetical protein
VGPQVDILGKSHAEILGMSETRHVSDTSSETTRESRLEVEYSLITVYTTVRRETRLNAIPLYIYCVASVSLRSGRRPYCGCFRFISNLNSQTKRRM